MTLSVLLKGQEPPEATPETPEAKTSSMLIIIIASAVSCVFLSIAAALCLRRRLRRNMVTPLLCARVPVRKGQDNTLFDWHRVDAVGRGPNGVVYKGVSQHDGRVVAIKHLPNIPDHLQPQIEKLVQYVHPNILSYLGFQCLPEHTTAIMEYSEGNLRSLLKGVKSLSTGMLHRYLHGILDGLGYLHAHGLVHLNLKPGNIFFDATGVPKLADFALAPLLQEPAVHVLGMQSYMPPEASHPPVVHP